VGTVYINYGYTQNVIDGIYDGNMTG